MLLLVNAILITLYLVQTFSAHHPCLVRSGYNITNKFVNAFGAGFAVLLADAFNSNVLIYYFRFKEQYEENKFGIVTRATRRLTLACRYTEWALRASIMCVSLIQLLLLQSKTGVYCIHQLGVLGLEGKWISYLIVL